jgi:hypothetical protein
MASRGGGGEARGGDALSRRRRWATQAVLSLFGIAGALGIIEAVVRMGLVPPHRQVVRGNDLHLLGGVPIWREKDRDATPRENRRCVEEHPDRIRILFFGTSITFNGAVEDPAQTFPLVLEKELNARRPAPGFCVLNFGMPAFGAEQRYAVAAREIPRYHPAVVLDQDWLTHAPSPFDFDITYEMIGDAAFALEDLKRRGDGLPGLRGVPDGLNHVLFLHSRLYQWVTLAQGEVGPSEKHGVTHEEELVRFAALVRANGAKPAFFLVPELTYPLAETSRQNRAWADEDLALGKQHGFAVVELRPLLADLDYTQIRLDSWHMNAKGNVAVGQRLVPFVLGLLDQPSASPKGDAPGPP